MKYARTGLAACVVLALAACGNKPAPLTPQEKHTVSEMTTKMETRCVGRYLIDLPDDASPSGFATVQGVNIDVDAMSQQQYEEEIAHREAELKAIKSIDTYPILFSSGEAWEKGSRYFIHRGTPHDDPGNRIIEGYKWDSGFRFKLSIEASDFTNPDQTDDPLVKKMAVKNDVPEKHRLVFNLLKRLRGRTEDDIPTEPGLCFAGGFLSGRADRGEKVVVSYVLGHRQDVSFDFKIHSDIREEQSLLQRGAQAMAAIELGGNKVIRKGTVDLPGGMRAEEIMAAGPTVARLDGHTFRLEVNTTVGGPQTPFFALDMTNGGSRKDLAGNKIEKASLTEGEAVALWDAVTRTLRSRSNGF
jgi:hypothetical protein